ncbi:elongation factor P [Novosphingobium aerophilum]|uniref:Elongation factor P n=1 Tax=Novosphingobium aerophilum TaxID=2839843 RepID=A0A7X1F5M4_9SPHN|nr:elongation factor P [Novosphingobium aerophilum]MBC2650594.1 elongation factor P [Novosphingobium aerophilum]
MKAPAPLRRISRSGCLALALLCPLAPAAGAPGGPVGVLTLGRYTCELPGDALGAAWIPQPAEDFTIAYGSTYRTELGHGTYLLTGDRLRFTAGPLKDAEYRRTGNTLLRRILPDGTPGRLRCVRRGGLTR